MHSGAVDTELFTPFILLESFFKETASLEYRSQVECNLCIFRCKGSGDPIAMSRHEEGTRIHDDEIRTVSDAVLGPACLRVTRCMR